MLQNIAKEPKKAILRHIRLYLKQKHRTNLKLLIKERLRHVIFKARATCSTVFLTKL